MQSPSLFLSFSDAAKYADVARSLVGSMAFGSKFVFWYKDVFQALASPFFSAIWMPPVMPFSIALFFKLFDISDFAVIATSSFYFILTLIFTYLLGKKVFESRLVAGLSTLAVGFNYDLIHYAVSGASESPFIFEIVAAGYFASLKKRWGNVTAVILLVLMYFTRPQAFIYIAGIILYWLLINFKTKKALIYFSGIITVGLLVDYFILTPLSGKYFLYSVIFRWISTGFNQGTVASDALRGGASANGGLFQTLKNIFYNLYNFYKLLPQIISPYLFALFGVGMFFKSKSREENSFKIATLFMSIVTLLVTAASIPFFRYIHPVIPLVYLVAVGTLAEIIKSQVASYRLFVILACILVLFFGIGQTLGILLLDSRFEKNNHNVGKPPVYVQLSYLLRGNTGKDQTIITNLDTWGSWYGERKTVWFPIEPKQIINPATGKIPFDAVYLTSYLIDDPNYYMGSDWRMIFDNPNDPKKWVCDGCSEIAKEFKVRGIYKVSAADDYEKQDAMAVLLVKK